MDDGHSYDTWSMLSAGGYPNFEGHGPSGGPFYVEIGRNIDHNQTSTSTNQ